MERQEKKQVKDASKEAYSALKELQEFLESTGWKLLVTTIFRMYGAAGYHGEVDAFSDNENHPTWIILPN